MRNIRLRIKQTDTLHIITQEIIIDKTAFINNEKKNSHITSLQKCTTDIGDNSG